MNTNITLEATMFDVNAALAKLQTAKHDTFKYNRRKDEILNDIDELKKQRKVNRESLYNSLEMKKLQLKEKTIRNTGKKNFIMKVCSTAFNCEVENMKSKNRKRELVYARNMFVYFFKKHSHKISLDTIGKMVGYKDHSNCIHALKSHSADVVGTEQYRNGYEIALPLIEEYFLEKKE